jgi:hypothetical protein
VMRRDDRHAAHAAEVAGDRDSKSRALFGIGGRA